MNKDNYKNYYVAFLDILGFKEIVKNNSFEKINALIGKYDKKYVLELLNYGLNDTIDEIDPTIDNLKIVQFSDSIIISVPSNRNMNYSFDTLLLVLRDLIADCLLNHDILLRGGIAEGDFYIKDNKLFGTALNEAYSLENLSAIYPRVIFTKKLLNDYENKCLGSMLCKSITEIDEDDFYFVDYLFSLNWDLQFRKENKVWVKKYKNINEKIVNVYKDMLTKETNNRVREKYIWLKHYYEKTQIKIKDYFEKVEMKRVSGGQNMDINLLVSNIQNLCSKNNVSVDKMLKECGLKPSVVDNMKKGSFPSVDKISKIANYFNVSIDYLLTGKEKSSTSELTDIEQRMLIAFRNLTPEDRLIEIGRAEGISEKYTPEQKENVS